MSPPSRSFPAKASSPADRLQYDEEVFAKDFARLRASLDSDGYKGIKYDQEQFKKDCEAAEIPWPPPGLSQSRWATPASAPAPAPSASATAKPCAPKELPVAVPASLPAPAPATSKLSPVATPFVPRPPQESVVTSPAPNDLSDKPPTTSAAPVNKTTPPALGDLAQSRWATTTPDQVTIPTSTDPVDEVPLCSLNLAHVRRSTKTKKTKPAAPRKTPTESKPVTTTAPDSVPKARPCSGRLGGLAQSCWASPSPDSTTPATPSHPVAPASSSTTCTMSKPANATTSAAGPGTRPRGTLGGMGQSRWAKR